MQKWAHKGWFNKNSAQGHDLEQKYSHIFTEFSAYQVFVKSQGSRETSDNGRWQIGTDKQQSANLLNFILYNICSGMEIGTNLLNLCSVPTVR